MYPKIEIRVDSIIENINKIRKMDDGNRNLTLVTKILAGEPELVKIICERAKITDIADSHIINLKKYKDIPVRKWLINEPGLSEITEVVKYADISFNCELKVLKALNEEAKKQNKIHGVLLTYELGDIREGCNKKEIINLFKDCKELNNIKVYGIASNLSCLGGVIPSIDNMNEMENIAKEIEDRFDTKLEIVSALNTSAIPMLKEKRIPKKLNSIRMGEAIFCGYNTAFSEEIKNFKRDTFTLKAEIVEIKEKDSIPKGVSLVDASGNKPYFEDKGIRKKALLGIGNEETNVSEIVPKDKQIEIISGSSNYTVLDITDCDYQYKVGDVVEFKMSYFSILKSMISEYVEKEIC